jgi:hypothetical protein
LSVLARQDAAPEAYQCGFDIVKQLRPRAVGGLHPGDEDVIDPGKAKTRQEHTDTLAQPAARTVADDGVADFLGGGKAGPGGIARGRAPARLHNDVFAPFGRTLCDKQEFPARAEPLER